MGSQLQAYIERDMRRHREEEKVKVATLEMKVTELEEMKNLLALISSYGDELPQPLVDQLKQWPEIGDVIKHKNSRLNFLANELNHMADKAQKLYDENGELKTQLYSLQKIKRSLFKQLKLSRKGNKK